MLRRSFCLSLPAAALGTAVLAPSTRRTDKGGWIVVRLAGTPAEIGFQHGAALAHEIDGLLKTVKVLMTHGSNKDWTFFHQAAEQMVWPKIESEYREEIKGITEGAASQGVRLDLYDAVALNAYQELTPYYTDWYDHSKGVKDAKSSAPEHCSAFVATGSWTADGRPVVAHNCWTDYAAGARWNIIFDVRPAKGHRFLMDGAPGLIHSGDDFGINGAGILITETTIGSFHGFDPDGIPECVRARKAMQYAGSVDEFAALMKDGNNGGYANTWLVADRKNGEVASLELGLKHVTLERTRDGFFVGSNFPQNEALIKDETTFDPHDLSASGNARRKRWEALMAQHKGRIDVELAKLLLADHFDTFDRVESPCERTLCGHVELSPRGAPGWQQPYGAAGAVQNKAADARLAEQMSLWAAMGHACGISFKAADHLVKHPDQAWQKDVLIDMPSGPWTLFSAGS
ncbi:MAG: C45 family autoproteolytic acyltransferase/hydolase [Bryobacteraceae bacterium]